MGVFFSFPVLTNEDIKSTNFIKEALKFVVKILEKLDYLSVELARSDQIELSPV